MASIITSILNSIVGLLLNKVRDKTADKLKDGDITDAKIREIIVRELDDVKSKIDGLSRKDLLSSYNFLQEGVNLLKASLDESEEEQKVGLGETENNGSETSTKPRNVECGILTGALALSQALRNVKMNSDEQLIEFAKKRFKDARKEATKAFCNEALTIEDRVFAAKLRIVSELLECIERPDTAIINCLPFLEKLHNLHAIREIFSVYIYGGVRSIVNKAERVENVKSVMLINYVLFQFVSVLGSKYCSAMTWPAIELADRSFLPVLNWLEISTRRSWGKEFKQPPNELFLDEEIDHALTAVSGNCEIIVPTMGENINITSRTGEVKLVKLNYAGDGDVIARYIKGLAVDSKNNVYVLMYFKTRTGNSVVRSYVLYVFDENYNAKQNCTLHFLEATLSSYVEIAINKNNSIILYTFNDPYRAYVYVCDNAGELKHKFKQATSLLRTLTFSDKNDIFLASDDLKVVHRYTEKGDLKSTIKVPEGHEIRSMAFHHVICKLVVLTFIRKSASYFLLCYSGTGEPENATLLWKTNGGLYSPVLKSHSSGPVAVVWRKKITFI